MKVQCIKEKLRNAVSIAERMTGKNHSLPALNAVLVIADKNTVTLRATNLDLGVEVRVPAKVEKNGTAAIPGSVLSGLLSNVNDETVSLAMSGENIRVSTRNSSTTIKSVSSDDFPTLPNVSSERPVIIPAPVLVNGFKSVWYGAATSDIKPEISSVYVYVESGEIIFVATDSFRLAEKKAEYPPENPDFQPLLLPVKNVAEILRVFDGRSGDVTIQSNENQVSFYSDDGVYVTSRQIDGVFPDYKQIIPKEFSTDAVILRQDLLGALKLSNLFSDNFNQVELVVEPRNGTFNLASRNSSLGEYSTNLEGALTGKPVSLSFNHRYLYDCLGHVSSDSVALRMNGERKPLVVKGVGDQSFTYLVMPLNQ